MIEAFGLTSIPRKANPPAVDDISFGAHAGRVTALLGAPGAGKTTVLRLMLELQPGRGITHFKGRPLHHIAHPAREVGVLLGDVPGHPARSVRGHLRMLCAATGVPARRADEVLEVVGLVSLREERVGTLSRGMDRRLGLACALLPDPHTLVLDAPTGGLSAREARWLHGMLRAHAAQGGTVLYTTGDPKEAARSSDRVVTLDSGRLVADQEAVEFGRTRLRPRVAVRSPHAARLAAVLTKEARTERRSVEVVREGGNCLFVYGSTTADVGEAAFRNNILVHQLADETGDMGPGAGGCPTDRRRPGDEPVCTGREKPFDEPPQGDAAALSGEPVPADRAEPSGEPQSSDHPRIPGGRLAADRPGAADRTVSAVRPGAADRPVVLARMEAFGGSVTGVQSAKPDGAVPVSQEEPSGDASNVDRPHGLDDLSGHDRTQPLGGLSAPDPARSAELPSAPDGKRSTVSPESPVDRLPAASDRSQPDSDHASTAGAEPADTQAAGARALAMPMAQDGRHPDNAAPPPISVRPAPGPLRPLSYELRRATGVVTGFAICGAVLVVSAITAVLLARLAHTEQGHLFAAWPRGLPLPPAALGAGLLGALAFGDEFRHPALAANRGTVPRRLGLLAAKLVVSGAMALVLAFLTAGCDAEVLYLVYGRELTQVPADWFSMAASWFGLVAGCAWAGVLAAGVFRSTAAGLAGVLAVPVVGVPLVQKALEGSTVRMAAGLSVRMRETLLLRWPFGGERYLTGAARVLTQPVGVALALSLAGLLCAYLLTTLRTRAR
ncbi:ATP-binding cassette domain-containing protein [Streptomyces sp. NPDC086787]|uniref:ATP-binding cassette domain-containing protein n=1 Tax=Streptomyces sp. NPDC086787 TaxID=3365759 RepID=UPI0037F477B5